MGYLTHDRVVVFFLALFIFVPTRKVHSRVVVLRSRNCRARNDKKMCRKSRLKLLIIGRFSGDVKNVFDNLRNCRNNSVRQKTNSKNLF